mmetsp:Transcript_59684/g.158846  ORF Transcript_59684/g.158846 Transcript_59684/m.158846 type:complete len:237 (-) Transcript_59684:944-1654(-)
MAMHRQMQAPTMELTTVVSFCSGSPVLGSRPKTLGANSQSRVLVPAGVLPPHQLVPAPRRMAQTCVPVLDASAPRMTTHVSASAKATVPLDCGPQRSLRGPCQKMMHGDGRAALEPTATWMASCRVALRGLCRDPATLVAAPEARAGMGCLRFRRSEPRLTRFAPTKRRSTPKTRSCRAHPSCCGPPSAALGSPCRCPNCGPRSILQDPKAAQVRTPPTDRRPGLRTLFGLAVPVL